MIKNKIIAFLKYYWISILSTIIILSLTGIIYFEIQQRAKKQSKDIFLLVTDEAKRTIENRILDNIQILKSTEAFVSASDTVTREDWKRYLEQLKLEKTYPGIQGLGYSLVVPEDQLQKHIEKVRAEGFPEYTIKPEGKREIYTTILFIHPFEGSNLKAFGYDMYSEPTRRQAMDRAKNTGKPALSGKVKLVQESDKGIQPGFLIYLPVYQPYKSPKNIKERQRYIRGYVYNPFRAYDLMDPLLKEKFKEIDIEIYDENLSANSLLYNKNSIIDFGKEKNSELHYVLKELRIAGRTWKIYFSSTPGFQQQSEKSQGNMYLISGILLAIMSLVVTSVIAKARSTQREAELRTKENALLLHKIFMEVPAIVGLIKATDQSFILVNSLFQKTFGNKQLLNVPIRTALPDLEGQGFFEPLDKVINSGKAYIGKEIPATFPINHHADPSTIYFNFVYQPLLDQQGKVETVMMFAVEISEQIMARQDLSYANTDLNEKNIELSKINNDLDNFMYTASHDLKAPISNMEGLVSLLEEIMNGYDENREIRELLKMINQSIHRFKLTIQDLTDITKIQKNIEEDIQDISIQELLNEVEEDYKAKIEETKADIYLTCHVPTFKFSKTNLRSILQNLLSNALKYRSPDRDLKIQITCEVENHIILLKVQDNGLGIRKSHLEKIFGMFKRLHTHVEGTGIGLYIVKRIAENYGGKITVESEEGVGSTFCVYIPSHLIDFPHN